MRFTMERLLLILLSGVRTEKHNGMYLSWESGGRIVLDVAGSIPAFPIPVIALHWKCEFIHYTYLSMNGFQYSTLGG